MVRLTYPAGVAQDFFTRTLSGGVITVVASVCMLLLFISELWLYMSVQTQTELLVDTSTGEQMQINVRTLFTLPSPSCRFASRPPPPAPAHPPPPFRSVAHCSEADRGGLREDQRHLS